MQIQKNLSASHKFLGLCSGRLALCWWVGSQHSTVLGLCYHLLGVEQNRKTWVRCREITSTSWPIQRVGIYTGNFYWWSHWDPLSCVVIREKPLCLSAFETCPNAVAVDGGRQISCVGKRKEGLVERQPDLKSHWVTLDKSRRHLSFCSPWVNG